MWHNSISANSATGCNLWMKFQISRKLQFEESSKRFPLRAASELGFGCASRFRVESTKNPRWAMSSAPAGRQIVAPGVSLGTSRSAIYQPRSGDRSSSCDRVSVAPPGLHAATAMFPRLTPGATICRRSAAEIREIHPALNPESRGTLLGFGASLGFRIWNFVSAECTRPDRRCRQSGLVGNSTIFDRRITPPPPRSSRRPA